MRSGILVVVGLGVILMSLLSGCAPAASCDLVIVGTDDPELTELPAGAPALVSGTDVDPNAWEVIPDEGLGAGDQVAFRLDPEAAARFAGYTRANIGGYLAIAVDDRIVAVPMIMAPIVDGQISVSVRDPAQLAGFEPCLALVRAGGG